jgi:hypothetical protein
MSPWDAEEVPHIVEARRVARMSKEDQHCYWMYKRFDEKLLSYAM